MAFAARIQSPDFCPLEVGCPIRISADQSLFAAPHGFSQRTTSFIACACQGIHRTPLRHLIALIINARPFRALRARERTAGIQRPEPRKDRARPYRLKQRYGPQPRRRAGGTAGKTSVTRELPVGDAVKLRQLSLIPSVPCGTAGMSGQLFSSRCQQTGSLPRSGPLQTFILATSLHEPRTAGRKLVEPDGIEPTTSCLQSRRSPN